MPSVNNNNKIISKKNCKEKKEKRLKYIKIMNFACRL
jgi:hypothetical protein